MSAVVSSASQIRLPKGRVFEAKINPTKILKTTEMEPKEAKTSQLTFKDTLAEQGAKRVSAALAFRSHFGTQINNNCEQYHPDKSFKISHGKICKMMTKTMPKGSWKL